MTVVLQGNLFIFHVVKQLNIRKTNSFISILCSLLNIIKINSFLLKFCSIIMLFCVYAGWQIMLMPSLVLMIRTGTLSVSMTVNKNQSIFVFLLMRYALAL